MEENTMEITLTEYRDLQESRVLVEILRDFLENRQTKYDSDKVCFIESVLGVNYETAKETN